MASYYDPELGVHYEVPDPFNGMDKQVALEVINEFDTWTKYLFLRPHYRRQVSTLDAEQRSRLAYWDDLIKKL